MNEIALENSIKTLSKQIKGLESRIKTLETNIKAYVLKSDLSSGTADLRDSVDSLNAAVQDIETKLQKIVLPEDTRLYLQESEVADFRAHFRQLRALAAEVERSRQAMIRLMSRFNLTNSV